MIKNKTNVLLLSNKALADKIEKYRKLLKTIVETITLCGRQNIALRGHRYDGALDVKSHANCQGNFRALLKYSIFSGNDTLKEHLEVTAAKNATMISKTTQEQLIRLCGEYVIDQIVEKVKQSIFYSVLADETTDTSTK